MNAFPKLAGRTAALCLLTVLAFALPTPHSLAAGEKEFEAAKREYEQTAAKGGEAARSRYVFQLAKMIDRHVTDHLVLGRSKDDEKVNAIYAELRRHPAPKNADARTLSRRLVGKWESPRHEYLYRADGTWRMIEGLPHGRWRIEGNQCIHQWSDEPKEYRGTIIGLNTDYFIYADATGVFFHSRVRK